MINVAAASNCDICSVVLYAFVLLFLQLSFMLTPINAPRDNNRIKRNKKKEAIFNSSNQDLEDGKNMSGFSFIFHTLPFLFM